MSDNRRQTTFEELTTPCFICNSTPTERHHLLDFSVYGKNNVTVQLCPNCHYLYHLIDKVSEEGVKYIGDGISKSARILQTVNRETIEVNKVGQLIALFNLGIAIKNATNNYVAQLKWELDLEKQRRARAENISNRGRDAFIMHLIKEGYKIIPPEGEDYCPVCRRIHDDD